MLFEIEVNTHAKREVVDITDVIRRCIDESGVENGLCFLFVPHASASVTVNENTDPDLFPDMISAMTHVAPQRPEYGHYNSDAHVQASLFGTCQTLMVRDRKPVLGHWQGVLFCEWDGPRSPRRILVEVIPTTGVVRRINAEKVLSKVQVVRGPGGCGGPVVLEPSKETDAVVYLDGPNVHNCARHIADLAGVTAVDGTTVSPALGRVLATVVGTTDLEQVQPYVQEGIPVINTIAVAPPQSADVSATLYVTGVRECDVHKVAVPGAAATLDA
jgi:secondary thiamine-phosphate synthase enzyme